MGVLTDPAEHEVEGGGRHQAREPPAFRLGIAVSPDPVKGRRLHRQDVEEPFAEVAAEARGMVGGNPAVFVEVEERDVVPGDSGSSGERLEHLELRRASGHHQRGLAPRGDRVPQGVGRVRGGGSTHRRTVGVNRDLHAGAFSVEMPTARRGFVATSWSIAASSRPRCRRRLSRT